MPELPEVETVCRGLDQQIIGLTISHVTLNRPNLRYPFPDKISEKLSGLTIKQVKRVAKYILISFDNSEIILIGHLGMSGRFLFCPKTNAVEKHDHCIFSFKNHANELRYNDTRRFGFILLENSNSLMQNKHFKNLGLDPFDKKLSTKYLFDKFKNKKSPIKTALMDQRIIAGLGNIYVCDSLYWAKIHPTQPAQQVSLTQLEILLKYIREVLTKAIKAGGSSLRDYQNIKGELGYFQHQWAVYGKLGQACPNCNCNIEETGGIKKLRQAGRASFYCEYQEQE